MQAPHLRQNSDRQVSHLVQEPQFQVPSKGPSSILPHAGKRELNLIWKHTLCQMEQTGLKIKGT